MQQKPAGWPTGEGVETVPQVRLVMEDGQWPPSDGELPSGTAEAGSWQITRDLTGGGLPGDVRGTSGFSIAEGQVQIPQPADEPVSPWGLPGRRATVAGPCRVEAVHPGLSSGALRLGDFMVDEVSGASISTALDVSIIERQASMGRFSYYWQYEKDQESFDAADVITQALNDSGYRAHPTASWASAIGQTVLLATFGGKVRAESSSSPMQISSVSSAWASASGVGGQSDGATVTFSSGSRSISGRAFSVLASVGEGGARFRWGDVGLDIRNDRTVLTISGAVAETVAYAASGYPLKTLLVHWNADTKLLAVVDLQSRDGVDENLGTFAPVVLAALTVASAPAPGTYASLVADNIPLIIESPTLGPSPRRMLVGASVFIGPLSISPTSWIGHALTAPWEPQTRIEMTDSPLNGVIGVLGVSGTDAWEALQEIAKATMGALWRDEAGRIVYRGRRSLRGDTPIETIDALDSLESVDWVLSSRNTADRVELTYIPTQVTKDPGGGITLWEATDPIQIQAGETRELAIDFNGSTDRFAPFLPVWDLSLGPSITSGSRWAAAYNRFGGDEVRPPDDALIVSAEVAGPSRARITITNTTKEPLWTVDGNGNTQLTLRTTVQVEPGEAETVSAGLPESQAVNPYAFTAGAWVQSPTVAQEMLAWLRDQTMSPNPVIKDVRVAPDLGRQLGDPVIIKDAITSLISKAVISGVFLTGDAYGYEQRLTLALLEQAFSDLDRWAGSNDMVTFADLDAELRGLGITTFQGLAEWLSRNLLSS